VSVFRGVCLFVIVTALAAAQQTISLTTQDGVQICADLYGQGSRGVVFAHGGRFNKESWRAQANALVSEGFRVLAIDFRGSGCSTRRGLTNSREDIVVERRVLEVSLRSPAPGHPCPVRKGS
jgi:pimeloyl-ACP methyl ester carboxylesterase